MISYRKGAISHGATGEGGTGASALVVQQSHQAKDEPDVLAINLMEKVCTKANLNRAYKRVKANKGAPGVDGLTVNELAHWIRNHKEQLIQALLDGRYTPQPIRKVMIPKPGGGERQLGIPTVVDRLIQQAILQILEPIFDAKFSNHSYGFRPKRSAHDALKQAKEYVADGYNYVVDIDLEKFFDRVNHDILMSRLARVIGDKQLLKLVRGYLTAGIMQDGVVMSRYEGTPQGGPLSPLLSNILLDELDKELERRGHKFCRYADDQNIYVRSERAGLRVYKSIKKFLEKRLKLRVNEEKSTVAKVSERKFLGYCIEDDGRLTVAKASITRAKDKVRKLSWRSRGKRFEQVIRELNQYLIGWLNYYRLAEKRSLWRSLDSWVRRKLRCYKVTQLKGGKSLAKFLRAHGIPMMESRKVSSSGKGRWRISRAPALHRALNIAWFTTQGLICLEDRWGKLLKS
jgi:RNA-directed DNA polymerase